MNLLLWAGDGFRVSGFGRRETGDGGRETGDVTFELLSMHAMK